MRTLCQRAAADAEFRSLCLSDINAAIREVSGMDVPAGVNICAVDGTNHNLALVIPPMGSADGALTDHQLEKIAGGQGHDPGSNPATQFLIVFKALF